MTDQTTPSPAKAAYSPPRLMVYGQFANLTAGGTGSRREGAMGTALMRFP